MTFGLINMGWLVRLSGVEFDSFEEMGSSEADTWSSAGLITSFQSPRNIAL
jgi:hypothetical protein